MDPFKIKLTNNVLETIISCYIKTIWDGLKLLNTWSLLKKDNGNIFTTFFFIKYWCIHRYHKCKVKTRIVGCVPQINMLKWELTQCLESKSLHIGYMDLYLAQVLSNSGLIIHIWIKTIFPQVKTTFATMIQWCI